jgi:hypothetical protein
MKALSVLLFSAVALASPVVQSRQSTPIFANINLTGDGCPKGSFTKDNTTRRIAIEDMTRYVAQTGGSSPSSIGCTFEVDISFPAGCFNVEFRPGYRMVTTLTTKDLTATMTSRVSSNRGQLEVIQNDQFRRLGPTDDKEDTKLEGYRLTVSETRATTVRITNSHVLAIASTAKTPPSGIARVNLAVFSLSSPQSCG